MRIWIALTLLVQLGLGGNAHARGIHLDGEVLESLNAVLETTVDLHKSMFGQDEMSIGESLDRLIDRLNDARTAIGIMAAHDRQHLELIINAIKNEVERTQYTSGAERREHVKETFYQLAHLTRIYSLDPQYNVFFCSKDRSHWVQSGRTGPRNPINPETLERCGKIVR